MGLHGIRMSALLLGMLGSGCGGGAELPRAAPAALSLTAGSGLAPGDDIDSLDLSGDAAGALHVVWRERGASGAGGRDGRVVYRRGDGDPLHWGAAVVVPGASDGVAQVVATPDGAHVFVGPRLRHWLVPVGGGAARDLGPVLATTDPAADAFDAIAADGDIVIAYRGAATRGGGTLYGLRWTPQGHTAPVPIHRASRAAPTGAAAPRLAMDGRRVMALWTWSDVANVYDASTRVTTVRTVERLHAAWSADGGQGWSAATDVASVPQSDIPSIAAAGAAGAPVVFFAAHGLFAVRWQQGRWSAPVPLVANDPHGQPGSTDVTAVAATQCEGRAAVAWTDARYRRSDRRWWNPLGGVPWSDNPDWANNDLFVLAPVAPDGAGHATPRRLSSEGSYTDEVAIAQRDGELIVIHTGRARVRKSPQDAGAPPEVLQSRVPCG